MKRLAIVAVVILLVVALLPREHLVGPDWDIYIADQDGKPVPGIRVRVYESNPTAENEAPDIVRTTDSEGHIFLPQRIVRVSTLKSAWGTLKQMRYFVHGEFNAYGYGVIEYPPGYGHPNINEAGSQGIVWLRQPGRVASRAVIYRCEEGVQRLGCEDKTNR